MKIYRNHLGSGLLVCVVLAVTVLTFHLTIGHRELRQETEALPGGASQEVMGHVIVMVASGWTTWPDLPQCNYDTKGRFTNLPCIYGGMTF